MIEELAQDAPKCRPAVKIGAVYPLTGRFQIFGISIQHAVNLAVDIVNRPCHLPLPLAGSEGLPNLDNRRIEVIWADFAERPGNRKGRGAAAG